MKYSVTKICKWSSEPSGSHNYIPKWDSSLSLLAVDWSTDIKIINKFRLLGEFPNAAQRNEVSIEWENGINVLVLHSVASNL